MVFGKHRASLCSVVWQKHGLPPSHMLVWLIPEHKIIPDKIDDVISAEIPDPPVDPDLHQVVISNIFHGPCGSINPDTPCMEDDQCTKKYPKPFMSETQLGADGYPLYRRRNPEDEEQVCTITMRVRGCRFTQEIDNSALQKIFAAVIELPLQRRAVHVHHIHQVCAQVCKQRL